MQASHDGNRASLVYSDKSVDNRIAIPKRKCIRNAKDSNLLVN